jgi:adenine deaminase
MTSSLTRSLIDVCMGRKPADMVIRKGNWVCVQSGEFVPDTDIAIKNSHIAYVGPDAAYTIAKETRVIDAEGKYLVPGLLDGHMHVESGMVTVTEFVRAVLPHGTTSMFIDPHEMANVFGLKGVKLMADEAARQPSHVWVQMPSCVPSYPGLETPGGEISSEDVAKAMQWDNIIGLGEMMNYRAVTASSPAMLAEMETTLKTGKVVGGHYASPDLGPAFHAYAAGGPEDDHEGTRIEDAVARARQGMWVMLRSGSAWKDVAAQVAAITRRGLASNRFILCTDDSHAGTLVYEGHMDRVVREAIAEGLPSMTAIQMATINTAEHFGVSREVGMIAPGRWADILLVNDLEKFEAEWVLCRGRMAAKNNRLLLALPKITYPAWATHSIHIKRPLTASDFQLRVNSDLADAKAVKVNVIEIVENCAPTNHKQAVVQVKEGEIQLKPGLAKLALVERHHKTGIVQLGLVSGFGFTQPCGIASSVAHDSHHLLVAGTSEADMALAANKLAEIGGGQVVVMKGKVFGQVELTIGGLMSTEKAPKVAQKVSRLLEGFRACGCTLNNANSTLSLLALVVIPELRLSDKGLVDVVSSRIIPLVEAAAG